MGGVNVAIDVGKRQLEVALGSAPERFTEPDEPPSPVTNDGDRSERL
jgi:hypothetical protein